MLCTLCTAVALIIIVVVFGIRSCLRSTLNSWAEHNKLKGMSSDDARQLFCKVYGEARHFTERNFRKF